MTVADLQRVGAVVRLIESRAPADGHREGRNNSVPLIDDQGFSGYVWIDGIMTDLTSASEKDWIEVDYATKVAKYVDLPTLVNGGWPENIEYRRLEGTHGDIVVHS
jgi:hypothetical protein